MRSPPHCASTSTRPPPWAREDADERATAELATSRGRAAPFAEERVANRGNHARGACRDRRIRDPGPRPRVLRCHLSVRVEQMRLAMRRIRLIVVLARPAVLVLVGMFAAVGLAQAGRPNDGALLAKVLLAVIATLLFAVAVNDI